ncbi:hypothetical protein [Nonomuraea zeae]|uniref:Uncharacterized protein n=1 Tax=Nonomuraea zeae TaxID=1642303 RepID=A0A5S4FXT0_9ACTN|nr:hypothetical protein [Nonomuraea zeae]TMR25074.1 hypothetical protein ETD85_45830 [Nonomuraea zeae]
MRAAIHSSVVVPIATVLGRVRACPMGIMPKAQPRGGADPSDEMVDDGSAHEGQENLGRDQDEHQLDGRARTAADPVTISAITDSPRGQGFLRLLLLQEDDRGQDEDGRREAQGGTRSNDRDQGHAHSRPP